MRQRLPATRKGKTHKIQMAEACTLYVTVNTDKDGNPREMFIKADNGFQGWCDVLAETASLYLQCEDGKWETLMRHWRGHRFEPEGGFREGSSIPDSIRRHFNDSFAQGK